MTQRNLTTQDIYEKDFKVSIRGYNSLEVDAFLDQILQDYEAYDTEIASLKAENARLLQRFDSVQNSDVADVTKVVSNSTGTTNVDILKRLSNLEKHVFGSKLDN